MHGPRGEQRVESQRDDRAAGDIVRDDREARAETREHRVRGEWAQKVEARKEQDGGEVVIEK